MVNRQGVDEWWRGLRGAVRRSRAGFVAVLVLLVGVHVAGAAHSAAFQGPYAALVPACPPAHAAPASLGGPPEPGSGFGSASAPRHAHDVAEHADHSADRPRTPATGHLARVALAPAGPAPDLVSPVGSAAHPVAAGGGGPPEAGTDPDPHRVLRQ
ncbi:hypothetical protein ACN20G_27970 (plasmid) [Streptomyces sp. BI20]|uniref:hypothetical protein n=1 Tax=Streptomyces sp. BI20 TaxID=3403460 RepID=UPI003C715FEB